MRSGFIFLFRAMVSFTFFSVSYGRPIMLNDVAASLCFLHRLKTFIICSLLMCLLSIFVLSSSFPVSTPILISTQPDSLSILTISSSIVSTLPFAAYGIPISFGYFSQNSLSHFLSSVNVSSWNRIFAVLYVLRACFISAIRLSTERILTYVPHPLYAFLNALLTQ